MQVKQTTFPYWVKRIPAPAWMSSGANRWCTLPRRRQVNRHPHHLAPTRGCRGPTATFLSPSKLMARWVAHWCRWTSSRRVRSRTDAHHRIDQDFFDDCRSAWPDFASPHSLGFSSIDDFPVAGFLGQAQQFWQRATAAFVQPLLDVVDQCFGLLGDIEAHAVCRWRRTANSDPVCVTLSLSRVDPGQPSDRKAPA